jgi:poly(3-hydroxybutyrate) depolymerase
VRRFALVALAVLAAAETVAACSGSGDDSTTTDASADGTGGSDAQSADVTTQNDSSTDAGITDASVDVSKPPCAANPGKTGFTNRTAAGNPYVAYVPSSYDGKTLVPLVVALHGAGDTAMNYVNVVWKSNADQSGFIVIAPEGTAPLGNGYTWNTSDESLVLAAATDVWACYAIDPKKEIVHGFSAGGIMAYLIGLHDAARFSGVSISSADLGSAEAVYGGSLLPSAWKIPVSHFHGTQDQNFPISYAIAGMDALLDAGHPFYWHPFDGGHTTNATFAATMYGDLKGYSAP